ncbi:MAG: hypothetical protein GXX86_03695 [Propionibacterium sp.]|nr:hypothetical protein [Propionibacterium sp.]
MVITCVRGRHEHLRRQRRWLAATSPRPIAHVVVNMGDPALPGVLAADDPGCRTLVVDVPGDPMRLSAARNAGVAAAIEAGADEVVLLDVDCLPTTGLIAEHCESLVGLGTAPSVVCGRVRYLPEGLSEADHRPEHLWAVTDDHRLRVVPAGAELVAGDPRMLWSLNIALRVSDWSTIGGFDEGYVGYGAEDTDFGQRLHAAGGTMWWSGRATAFHQYHPVSNPPVEHAASIARNANLFRRRWGFEPMEGWLRDLADLGMLRRAADGDWTVTGSAPA